MGASVLRVFSGVLASAAVSGAFLCAVAVVKPGAGPAPTWPAGKPTRATPMPLPREEPGPAARALIFTPVLTPAPAAVAALRPAAPARPRAVVTPQAFAPAPAAPATPAPEPAAPATVVEQAAAPQPQPQPTTPAPSLRHAAGQTVAATARTVATTVAPVSPPVAATVQQTGDAVAAVITGP